MVSEFGLDQDQEDHKEEDIQDMNVSSNMLEWALDMETGQLTIHWKQITLIPDLETTTQPHASTPEMMPEELGGLVTSELPTESDKFKSWTEVTAAGIDSMVPKFILVELDVDGSEIQEKEVGIMSTAQLMLEVPMLEL